MGLKTKRLNKKEVQGRIDRWWLEGLIFGVFMFILNEFILKPLVLDHPLIWKNVLFAFPIWMIGGFGYGYYMKWYLTRKLKKMKKEH